MSISIELAGIELQGFHGVLPEERRDGQRFLVDVAFEYAAEVAGSSDAISDAIDYRDVASTVREISDGRAFYLLEALAASLAGTLLERYPIAWVRVRVRKPDVRLDPPVEHAAVVVERRPQ